MSRLQISVAAYVVTGGDSAKDSVTILCNEQQVFISSFEFVPSLSSPLRRCPEDVPRPRTRVFNLSREKWI
jgi:hypothetical protein